MASQGAFAARPSTSSSSGSGVLGGGYAPAVASNPWMTSYEQFAAWWSQVYPYSQPQPQPELQFQFQPQLQWWELPDELLDAIVGAILNGVRGVWHARWARMLPVVTPYEADRRAYEDVSKYPQQPVVVRLHPRFVDATHRTLKLQGGMRQLGFVPRFQRQGRRCVEYVYSPAHAAFAQACSKRGAAVAEDAYESPQKRQKLLVQEAPETEDIDEAALAATPTATEALLAASFYHPPEQQPQQQQQGELDALFAETFPPGQLPSFSCPSQQTRLYPHESYLLPEINTLYPDDDSGSSSCLPGIETPTTTTTTAAAMEERPLSMFSRSEEEQLLLPRRRSSLMAGCSLLFSPSGDPTANSAPAPATVLLGRLAR